MRILMYQGISLFSRGIKIQTRSKYSHAAIELTDMTVVEALFTKGVTHANSFEQYHTPGTVVDVYTINDKAFDHDKAEAFALDTVGMPYDKMSVMRFVSHTPAKINGKYFCSEHVMETCIEGGSRLQRGDTAQMPPRDVAMSMGITQIGTRVTL